MTDHETIPQSNVGKNRPHVNICGSLDAER
jgi:hypothetical protein